MSSSSVVASAWNSTSDSSEEDRSECRVKKLVVVISSSNVLRKQTRFVGGKKTRLWLCGLTLLVHAEERRMGTGRGPLRRMPLIPEACVYDWSSLVGMYGQASLEVGLASLGPAWEDVAGDRRIGISKAFLKVLMLVVGVGIEVALAGVVGAVEYLPNAAGSEEVCRDSLGLLDNIGD